MLDYLRVFDTSQWKDNTYDGVPVASSYWRVNFTQLKW